MRRILPLVVLAAGLLLTACGPTAQILYNWGGEYDGVTEYERLAYRSSATESPESLCSMLVMYERLVNNPGGWRQVPPPGICAEYAWLLDNCWKYGFIIRYRQGREYITGYEFEPWHYRYVGGPAESIMKSGLTYEEYYAVYIDK